MKKLLFAAIAAVSVSSLAALASEQTTGDSWDAQARGLVAVTKNNISAAKNWFVKAAKMSAESKDWQGTVAAGSSLSTIGEHQQAAENFKIAEAISKKISDWQPSLAVGYAYASLPKAVGKLKEAAGMMITARRKAEKEKDWQGLIEVSRGFAAINEQVQANETLEKAENIITKIKDPQAFAMLANTLRDYGRTEEAEEYEKLAVANTSEEEIEKIKDEVAAEPPKKVRKKAPAPPPGWSPYGDSLAKPKKIDPASRAMLQERAHLQLSAAEERALMDRYEKAYNKANKYRYYYFYGDTDYPYRVWDRDHAFDLRGWAHKQLGHFQIHDGVFIRK